MWNLTSYFPDGSTLSTAMKSAFPAADFSSRRSKVNFTSAEVNSWPSCHLTPCRSLKVQVRPFWLTPQDSASSGTGVMFSSKRTSWLYVSGERRLRENAGTSWGSSPVASLFWAEMTVPPAFGAWADAARPRASVPRTAPPALRTSRRLGAAVRVASGPSCRSRVVM